MRPQATRSLTFATPGGALGWSFDEIPLPIPRNSVLVQVSRSTIGSVDSAIYKTSRLWVREKGVGRDFVGKILYVGSGQQANWKEGDLVMGMYYHLYGPGTLASHVLINPGNDHIVRVPDYITEDEAVSIPLSFTMAYQCLTEIRLSKDSTVCVLGGSTSIGMFAVQLAKKYFGVKTVVATCSAKNKNLVKLMGADEIVDYTSVDERDLIPALVKSLTWPPAEPNTGSVPGFDLVVDTVGVTPFMMANLKTLTPAKTGWFVSTVGELDGDGTLFLSSLSPGKVISGAVFGPRYKVEFGHSSEGALKLALELFKECKLKVMVESVIDWNKYQEGMDKLCGNPDHENHSERNPGKIVVQVEMF
ncbi:uncharacterized protein V1516DRAFT_704380 [Lipomyces oligophaga]|uniref:uncharacterized protein n=1 Tax=Lipomyces oligophaga TaxID=45792 RepID=UPI0034CF4B6C